MGLKWNGRKTWLALFTAVFCVVAVAPVLADPSDTSPIPEESQGSNDALGESPVSLPSSEDVIKGLRAVELGEEEREEELATPEAQHEREVSRGAYGDLSSAEAQQLFNTRFGDVIAALNNDPARFLSDAKLEHPLGEGSATVTSDGNTEILEAGMPVETKDEDGELGKVDLSFEKTNEGWVPANPLVDLSVGESAAEGIEVGTEGLAVTQVGAGSDSTAEPLGNKNLWFSEVEEGSDTDLLVSPTSMGVELFDILRSPASPETISFHLDLPEGAELRASEGGGAEIVDVQKSPLALVPSPTAVDAQGSSLPVDMEVNGSSLTVHVEHREADVAYPILLDPSILQDWYNANWYNNQNLQGLNAWGWQDSQNPHWIDHGTSDTSWPGHSCLCIATEPTNIPPNQWGQYYYSAPNAATYLANAWINPFWRNNRTCSAPNPYPQPHDYDGMWNETSWNRLLSNQANEYGSSNIESWGRAFIIGMSNGANWTNIPCWRDLMIGGVAIWLDDWDAPHLSSVTGIPTGWVKKDNTPRTISVAASDEGLGVQRIRFLSPGGKEWNWNQPWCSGTYENRCETSRSGQIAFETNSFPFEGDKVPVSVQALDPTEKGYNPWEYTMKLDGASPTVNLSGQLAGITAETGEKEKPQGEGKDELSLPAYKLAIEAKDGSASEPRSGVKEIKVYLDGKGTPEEVKTQTCSAGSCAMTMNYTLKLPGLSEGKHTLKVIAIDQVGNETKPERKIEFEYIPATGMKEEYVLQHFALPDGHNYSEEPQSHGPELAVNVMNGNVIYHERDIQVQTRRAGMEVERIYNSQLPTEKDTQWGHGWTLAQTPELKPSQGESPPQKASVMRTGAITNSVNIPVSESQPTFSSRLHASIDKMPGGSYEVISETDNETSVFSSVGRIQETRFTSEAASSGSTMESEPTAPTYQSSFGALGTGNGQFNHPAGSAIDAKGNIWIVDENNKRVEKFSEAGEYLSSFGVSGTGNGQFSRPTDVAIDSKGNLWVTDAGNNRIEQFNEKGEYITKFGSSGSGNGQFSSAESIAIDSKGNLWVGDTYNARVQEFNEKGEFIRAVGSYGAGQGQIIESTGIAVGPGNNVWVADWGNNRITEFSETGAFIRQFGTAGTGAGQFKQPDVIEIDAKGNVWVGDQNNARIQQFNQSGEYVGQFGTAGSGAGQFSFGWPMGISADAKGRLWISDTGNNRVQKWQIPNWAPTYQSSFGALGTGNGQFNHPAGSAIDAKGNIWIVDENNKRVEKFSEAGEYLSSFGVSGTGNGQFSRPTDVAIDSKGNLWVTDAGNNRIEQFNEKGEYITKFGSSGSGNGQFSSAESIAIDSKGNLWVGDTYNARVQEFNEKGEFIRAVGSYGAGQGQIIESTGIAVGPGNNVWVADWGNNRITEFSETGAFIRQFGTAGTGAGQFKQPDVIEIDAKGNVWVGDQNNARIQQFNQSGEYVGQFGTAGSGAGQFSFGWPMGISADAKGRLWISDTGNNRVQKWQIPNYVGPAPYNAAPAIKYTYSGSNLSKMVLDEPAPLTDPSLAVNVESGLTTSVSGESAGTASFKYETGKLTAATDPEGQAKYTYDTSSRLKRIELPNGTWAEVTYDSTSRATAVTVDPAGPETAKITHFSYSQEPRQTIVWGGGRPEVTYSIGEDGSVFKWSYAEVAPAIDSISGSLWGNRNSSTPVENKDQTLFVTGSSPHEISKVQVVVNGEAVLEEKTCEDLTEPPAHNCEHVTMEWVTHPAEHAAGQLNLEVVVTDFLGHQTAERFFVTIPQQPPPNPEAPPRPTFGQIKQFREEYGLDREHNYSESEMTALVLELLYEWELQKPTAMLAVEKWGVPLRSPEVAELEYREQYVEQFGELIPEWAQEHASTTYGGYYVDNRAGGIIYVGFTANQQAQVEALRQTPGLIAPSQVQGYPVPPSTAIATVEATEESVADYIAQNTTMMEATTQVGAEPGSTVVKVGSTNPQMVGEYLTAHFGASASIQTFLDQNAPEAAYSRYTTNGPLNPGDAIMTTPAPCGNELCWENCTANFGARAVIENREGHDVYAMFTMAAGHCGPYMELMNRATSPKEHDASVAKKLGKARRYLWGAPNNKGVTDAEAIRVDPDVVSSNVFTGNPKSLLPIRGLSRVRIGSTLCWSGRNGGQNCGPARRLTWVKYEKRWTRQVEVRGGIAAGDSGGPVWNMRTEKAVGIITSNWGDCHQLPNKARYCSTGGITPLMAYPNKTYPKDVLLGMGLELVRGDF